MFPESISLTTSSFSDGDFVAGLALDGIHNVGGGTAISTMDRYRAPRSVDGG